MILYKLNEDKLEEKKVITSRSAISALAYSPDGTLLAVGDAQGKIMVYDTSNYEVNNYYNYRIIDHILYSNFIDYY